MNSYKWIKTILLCFLLISCASYKNFDKAAILCTASCEKNLAVCSKTCRNNCGSCMENAQEQALKNFISYRNEQYVKGGLIARDLQSYRDPLQCRKTSCSCFADYELCRQNCGGYIIKKLQKPPIC